LSTQALKKASAFLGLSPGNSPVTYLHQMYSRDLE